MIIRRTAQVVLIGLLGVIILPGTPPAGADETTENLRMQLVLDVSGSMREPDMNGQTRMAVAQRAFNEVVDAVPAGTDLGIRVLGATYPGDDKALGCQDTQQIVPVGPVDRDQAKAAIASLRPTGFTPIGLALREAAKDLGSGETARRIVLITDGEDTCAPPDPCDVARELAAQGTRLIIDTLGLTLDDKVRQQLVCIAGATGGTYTTAQSADQLADRINQLVDRAQDTYTQTPELVTGSTDCTAAPLLAAGVYTDRERFEEHRWYRVPIRADQELRASVSIALDRPVNRDYGILLRAVHPNGRELVRGTDAGSGRTDVLSTGLRWSAGPEDGRADETDRADDADGTSDLAGTPTGAASAAAPTAADAEPPPSEVCLVVSNSFAAAGGAGDAPGMPIELTVDLVAASPTPDSPGLGRGWLLLIVLSLAGLVTGVLAGWLTRWWTTVWKES
ncbi:Ca-activated chloride channel family protein [Micromonospora sp. Llam0]|uniref:VWA domain-containing protein n=1 Tax=Micromonospora sp. Llam0 TaxID=2485143 RepID=UPI000F997673|nr:VWA domain-containing protein [Micromonospora sp. Llam0]ROO52060.1 Ca-activated chloride channel family protein [Micromonospora sp. Llam0]